MPKSAGKQFEDDFINSFPKNIFKYRLRDSAGTWQGGENTRFTPSNICDFIIHNGKWLYLLELKSHKGKSLPLSCIRDNQLKGLNEFMNYDNIGSYLIVNFREVNKTYSLPINEVINYKNKYPQKKSIPISYFEEVADLIPQTLKKVHYSYDLKCFERVG